jgi:hypothetical protein
MTLSARCRERVVSIAKTHEHFFFLSVLLVSYVSRQHIADCVVIASSFNNDFCHLARSRFRQHLDGCIGHIVRLLADSR